MTELLDPEGAHIAALRRLADFAGQRVLELGCGDGRLTLGIAGVAAGVLAFDPDADAVGRASDVNRTMRTATAERPVIRHARDGTHCGHPTNIRSKRRPCDASRSRLGVRTSWFP